MQTDLLWTDNVSLRGDKAADFVATVQPGIRLAANGDRLKASVDYSLSRYLHARDRSLDRNQNSLRADGKYEAIENFAFLDVAGSISQETISAFGPQSSSDANSNLNRTEVSTFRVSPYVRGKLGQWANYGVRYSRQTSHSKAQTAPSQNSEELSAQLNGEAGRALGWSIDLSRQDIDNSSGLSYQSDRLRAVLSHAISPQWVVAVIPGREANNFATTEKESHNTFGISLDWAPSDRTKLKSLVEKRFFGRAYQLNFEHRTQRTAWRLSNSRDVSATPDLSGALNRGPLYELLFFQFASIEPDPVRRAQLVDSYMLANGMDRNTQVRVGFLSSSATLSHRQDLSFTLLGQRDTLSFVGTQSRNSRLSQFTTELDDLSSSSVVRQRGLSLVYSRRLTPLSTLSATASHLRSDGDLGNQHSTLKSLNLSVSTRLGVRTSASLGLRRAIYDTDVTPYSESAVLAGLTVQF